MNSKITMTLMEDGVYKSACGSLTLGREASTKTLNGNNMNGRWVLRRDGQIIDFDQYRNDLAEFQQLELVE